MPSTRYTAAKRREIAAQRTAHAAAEDARQAALTLEEFLAEAAQYDLSTGAEFIEFHTARHAALTANLGVTA